MLPSRSTYLQISAAAGTASASGTHQAMARAHHAKAKAPRGRGIAAQCIKWRGQTVTGPPPSKRSNAVVDDLQAVIHLELDWMRRHPETSNFLLLERDIRVEHVVREHAAAGQKLAVLVETLEGLFERSAGMWDLGCLLGLGI